MEAMELWVIMVEGIFNMRKKETSDTWLTNTTPEVNWKDKCKDNNIVDISGERKRIHKIIPH